MPNLINTQDMVGAYMGSNQVLALYMGTTHVWGEDLGGPAIRIDCFDNMEAFEGATCSSVTITLVEMNPYWDNPEPEWNEGDVVGTITCQSYDERDPNDPHEFDPTEYYWYIASSSVTSAITSAEMYHDDDHGWMMRIVAPVFGNCVMTEYRLKAQAIVDGMGMAKIDLQDENGEYHYCSNGYFYGDWGEATWLKQLTITNLPNISPLTPRGDDCGYWVRVSDDNNFEFSHNHYYDTMRSEEIDEVSFDNYGNSDFSYQYDNSALTLVVYGTWEDYDGEGSGEYVIGMDYNDIIMYEATNRSGRHPLRFTGNSETFQFAACNPQCDAVLYIDFTIPSDSNEHTLEVNLGGDVIASITATYDGDVVDYQEEFDTDGYYYSLGVNDMGNGRIIWDVEGPFSGNCMITLDNNTLINGNPTFGGGYTIWYVDVDSDGKKEYSSYDAYSCEVENYGTWDDVNQECTYPE